MDRGGGLPREELVSVEPEGYLALRRVVRVTAVDEVAANVNAEVTFW
jgi:hypothetical protein